MIQEEPRTPLVAPLVMIATFVLAMLWWWSPFLPNWVPLFGAAAPNDTVVAGVVATSVPAVPAPVASSPPLAQSAPGTATTGSCAAGDAPAFVLGLAQLYQRLGGVMGEPLECEHGTAGTRDTTQHTSTGLAYYRAETGFPSFTDGWQHWALTSGGLLYWEGESVDPPPEARVVPTR